jgi:hypothetical protein
MRLSCRNPNEFDGQVFKTWLVQQAAKRRIPTLPSSSLENGRVFPLIQSVSFLLHFDRPIALRFLGNCLIGPPGILGYGGLALDSGMAKTAPLTGSERPEQLRLEARPTRQ